MFFFLQRQSEILKYSTKNLVLIPFQSLLGFSNRVKGIHDCLHKRKIKSYTYVNVRTERRTRTSRGMMTTTSGRKANRLLKERSPYLLQHAYNPVEW